MHIFIEYPAKAFVLPAPRGAAFAPVTIAGVSLYRLEGAKRVWVDQAAAKLHTQENPSGSAYYVPLSADCVTLLFDARDAEHAAQRLASVPALELQGHISKAADNMRNLDAYNAALAEKARLRREEKAADDARREQERLQREAKKAQEEEAAYQAARETYTTGGHIHPDHFERMCKDAGITLHMRTVGNLRATCKAIHKGGAITYGGRVSDGVWDAVRELNAALINNH